MSDQLVKQMKCVSDQYIECNFWNKKQIFKKSGFGGII